MGKTNAWSGQSLALLTDLYQLTMAYGYWKLGRNEEQAVFNLFFRKHPFRGGFTVACGLDYVIDFLENLRFHEDDIAYLATLKGNDDEPLFEESFLRFLGSFDFTLDVDSVAEGTVVFPHQPIVRVRGPLIQCQIVETALLNIINFQTLVASKAARLWHAAAGDPILEFGLRRAQGVDGALAASRAAYIGGCAATSNVLAGKRFGIPVRGTHAHSWVMSFEDELDAFDAYARVLPNNCVFLVDTYDTLEGVKKAIEVGKRMRQQGHDMMGIRLDSGDLAYLSVEARRLLDAAGFADAAIVASNDLDEHIITSLKEQGATISVWGVGTKLVTAYDQPALGGVYKLAAVKAPGQAWQYKVKLSEQSIKTSTPGILQIRRLRNAEGLIGDMIYDEEMGVPPEPHFIDPMDPTRQKKVPSGHTYQDLLLPIFRGGKRVYDTPPIADSRQRTRDQLESFHAGIRRLLNPHQYPVGLEKGLFDLRQRLILKARGLETTLGRATHETH